jgi:DNA-binding NarL/FixJ family response regulator
MKIYKIGIVDDHVLFAEGISRIIAQKSNYHLSFISNTLENIHDIIHQHQLDVLILDVNVPPHNGIENIGGLKRRFPALQIMILTMYQPGDIGLTLRDFSGDAYVLKISGKHIFEAALANLMNCQPYFDPAIIDNYKEHTGGHATVKLTKREKEIISLIAAGKTSKEIAAELFLSELTIKTHRKNISEKLGTRGIAEMISKTSHIRNV